MKKLFLLVVFLMLSGLSYAQTVDVGGLISKLPNLKQGVAFDINSKNASYFSTAEVINYKGFSLSAGYSTSSAIVASVDYDLGGLEKLGLNVPLLSMVDLRVGFMVGLSDISTATSSGSAERNKLVYGPEVTLVSVKF